MGKSNPGAEQASTADVRAIAARVLFEVLFQGGFAAAALDAELRRAPSLQPRDRGLATELVYGVVRTRNLLEERLQALAPRGIPDKQVRVHLMVAAYQLLLLDRIPSFAAVDTCVRNVKSQRGAKSAGFANAILRKLASAPKVERAQALEASIPPWLLTELTSAVGVEQALALFGIEGKPTTGSDTLELTPQALRFRAGLVTLPDWVSRGEPGRVAPGAWCFTKTGDLRKFPEHARGEFVVQEQGAQFASLALGARSGERILDACAGRGQKSSLLAEQLGPQGELFATDLSPKKLDALRQEFARLKLPVPTTCPVDWTADVIELDGAPAPFDRVLVDAPCTGTGTLRRRPEIALRLLQGDVERLATLSEQILRNAARFVRPEGRVLFVVCSVLHRECEAVVARVADVLEPRPFDVKGLELLPVGAAQFRLLPGTHGTDGFFMASLSPRGLSRGE